VVLIVPSKQSFLWFQTSNTGGGDTIVWTFTAHANRILKFFPHYLYLLSFCTGSVSICLQTQSFNDNYLEFWAGGFFLLAFTEHLVCLQNQNQTLNNIVRFHPACEDSDSILSSMHYQIQPKSLNWWTKMDM